MTLDIRSPQNQIDWDNYFDLRWRLLRQPWQQARGSEKDEFEDTGFHRLAIINGSIIAVGRLHISANKIARIRYMAVKPNYQRKGIGQKILQSLEQVAIQKNIHYIDLNAREEAVQFYQKQQYKLIEPAHTLYGQIKHFKMKKTL